MATEKFEERPWGSYETFEDDAKNRFWVKKLIVKPGQSLSLQKHQSRDEFWVCVEGVLSIEINGKEGALQSGEFAHLKKGDIHKAFNDTKKEVIFIEVATGQCFESDNIRLEDKYGRS